MTTRRGFALITVLWVIVLAAALAATGSTAGRDAAAAHKNRASATRAYWLANACSERLRFAVERILGEARIDQRDSVWRVLREIVTPAVDRDCSISLEALGDRVDVNRATEAELHAVLAAMGVARAPALAQSLSDWIDGDDQAREFGAESAAYRAAGHRVPRNGPIADPNELRYVIGFDSIAVDSVFGVDSARISIATAPLPVLASLPGFSEEAVERVAAWRAMRKQIVSLLAFAEDLSAGGEARLIASYPDLVRRSTLEPDAWIITARSESGFPAVAVTVETMLSRAQTRTIVLRRRTW